MVNSKSSLAVVLSKLQGFSDPKAKAEQYMTESEIAAQVLWDAFMKGDIEGKTVADLGCGTGILGLGAALLGAEKVFLVEIDEDAIMVLKKNIGSLCLISPNFKEKLEIVCADISNFNEKTDIVIQNPPFGTKEKHADKIFLEKAFSISDTVYSFHKTATRNFVEAISKDFSFQILEEHKFSFPLKATMGFHKKRIERIEVSCFKLVRQR